MTLFLILAPFGAFGTLMLVASPALSLFVAALVALAVLAWDVFRGKSVKILMASSMVLFGALGCYDLVSHGNWSTVAVRLAVDGGVLAIALATIAFRVPFTVQYAREKVAPEVLLLPSFKRVNYILTWAWSAAFLLMLIADVLMIYAPGLPLWVGVGIAFAARNAAVYFTKWYPQYRRSRIAAQAAAASQP